MNKHWLKLNWSKTQVLMTIAIKGKIDIVSRCSTDTNSMWKHISSIQFISIKLIKPKGKYVVAGTVII